MKKFSFKNIYKAIKLAALFCTAAVLCTGCWDSSDIQNTDIAMSAFVDVKNQNGEPRYEIYIETAKTKSVGGGEENGKQQGSASLLGIGRTFEEAYLKLSEQMDNPLFWSASRAVVMGENFCKRGIEAELNRMRGTQGTRKNMCVFVTRTDLKKLMRSKPVDNEYMGASMESKINNMEASGLGQKVVLQDLLETLEYKDIGFVVPTIVQSTDKHLAVDGYEIFDGTAAVGHIPSERVNGLIYLLSKNANFNYPADLNGNRYYFKAQLGGRSVKASYINGELTFDINIKLNCSLYYADKYKEFNTDDLNKMLANVNELAGRDIKDIITASQEKFHCDYLGFYKYFKRQYEEEFKDLNVNGGYKDAYTKAKINLTVNSDYISSEMQNLYRAN